MLIENVDWLSGKAFKNRENSAGEVILTGVIRGKSLKADRLVSVGDWGDFQISKITKAPLSKSRKARGEAMALDAEGDGALLEEPGDDRDALEDLAPDDIIMDEASHNFSASVAASERKGVLIDDHHYYSEDDAPQPDGTRRKLPRGTSKYQAAWYIGDVSDSGSDLEDYEEDEEQDVELEEDRRDFADGMTDIDMGEPTEAGPSEYPQSEPFMDPSPDEEADQIAAYREQKQNEVEDDLHFPDEIELQPNVLARERLARYRGLKNFRTSVWDTEEDKLHKTEEWDRLLEISNYKAAKGRALKDSLIGGVAAGSRVHVHLKDVPQSFQLSEKDQPLALYSLLRHEHKRTAVNCSIILNSDVSKAIRSKEEILVQCGPRRFLINPLFSSAGTTPNDVHKFSRYLHPSQTAIASFTGPLTWGSVPVLYFSRQPSSNWRLIGSGTSQPPSHTRVIAKRIILTGHPFKMHRRVVTVRYMFFNAEDVAWFKALRLWTKRGRSGFIKESLGTHGYFKATFDGKINPMDSVAVSLYKRVWPRPATRWCGETADEDGGAGAPALMES
jgi:pre-rRNA-processing protein TSR1